MTYQGLSVCGQKTPIFLPWRLDLYEHQAIDINSLKPDNQYDFSNIFAYAKNAIIGVSQGLGMPENVSAISLQNMTTDILAGMSPGKAAKKAINNAARNKVLSESPILANEEEPVKQ